MPFLGSIPSIGRDIVLEQIATWGTDERELYIACSGNFTMERMLAGIRGRSVVVPQHRLHSNDVNPYSCALGWFFAGEKVEYSLADEGRKWFPWVEPYFEDKGVNTAAAVYLLAEMSQFCRDHSYARRMREVWRQQFPDMHAKAVGKLNENPMRLVEFFPGDAREHITRAGEHPVMSFPPTYAGGYEDAYKVLDKLCTWPEPEYELLDHDTIDLMLEQITQREHWLFTLDDPRPQWAEYEVGRVKPTLRNKDVYIYSSAKGHKRQVGPHFPMRPVLMPKLGQREKVRGPLSLHPIDSAQFASLRAMYLNKGINHTLGATNLTFAVAAAGKLIGVLMLKPDAYEPNEVYLLSDFPVAPSRYRRLSKLIVMAAMSTEVQHLAQRVKARPVRSVSTTAFSDRPNAAKYGRGIPGMKLTSRADGTDAGVKYMLGYTGPMGEWDLAGALRMWQDQHSHDQLDDSAPAWDGQEDL